MDIVYLKLTNGDELFAQLIGEEDGKVLLSDVMVMETIHTEGDLKYLFMSRYTPYGELHSMSLDRTALLFMQEASEVIRNHYTISVQYAKTISDGRFDEGIADASRYLSHVLERHDKKKAKL